MRDAMSDISNHSQRNYVVMEKITTIKQYCEKIQSYFLGETPPLENGDTMIMYGQSGSGKTTKIFRMIANKMFGEELFRVVLFTPTKSTLAHAQELLPNSLLDKVEIYVNTTCPTVEVVEGLVEPLVKYRREGHTDGAIVIIFDDYLTSSYAADIVPQQDEENEKKIELNEEAHNWFTVPNKNDMVFDKETRVHYYRTKTDIVAGSKSVAYTASNKNVRGCIAAYALRHNSHNQTILLATTQNPEDGSIRSLNALKLNATHHLLQTSPAFVNVYDSFLKKKISNLRLLAKLSKYIRNIKYESIMLCTKKGSLITNTTNAYADEKYVKQVSTEDLYVT